MRRTLAALLLSCSALHTGASAVKPEEVIAFSEQVRQMPIREKTWRHLEPLGEIADAPVVQELHKALKAQNTPMGAVRFAEFNALRDTGKLHATNVMRLALSTAAENTPAWTAGDRKMLNFLKTSPNTDGLMIDPDAISPQEAVPLVTSYAFPDADESSDRDLINKVGIVQAPLFGETFLGIPFLTKSSLTATVPVAIATETVGKKIHGEELSPLGHAIHDLAHGRLAFNAIRKNISTWDLAYKLPEHYQTNMPAADRSKLRDQLASYHTEKTLAYQSALHDLFSHANAEKEQKRVAALFMLSHEAPLEIWPSPHTQTNDLLKNLTTHAQAADAYWREYYSNPFHSSWQTGNVPLAALPASPDRAESPHAGPSSLENLGGTVRMDTFIGDSLVPQPTHLPSGEFLYNEAQDLAKVVNWSAERGYKLPKAPAHPIEEDAGARMKQILPRIIASPLQLTKPVFGEDNKPHSLAEQPFFKKIAENYRTRVEAARTKLAADLQAFFGGKDYWDPNISLLPEGENLRAPEEIIVHYS